MYLLGTCPNDCSDRGSCLTINDMSLLRGPDYDSAVSSGGDGVGLIYENWEASSLTVCNCDSSYFGADCSLG